MSNSLATSGEGKRGQCCSLPSVTLCFHHFCNNQQFPPVSAFLLGIPQAASILPPIWLCPDADPPSVPRHHPAPLLLPQLRARGTKGLAPGHSATSSPNGAGNPRLLASRLTSLGSRAASCGLGTLGAVRFPGPVMRRLHWFYKKTKQITAGEAKSMHLIT